MAIDNKQEQPFETHADIGPEEFKARLLKDVDDFLATWIANHEVDPEDCPLEMFYGDWISNFYDSH